MRKEDVDRMIEEIATHKMSEQTRELAIQSGLIASYGNDHEGLRDFDYRKFAQLIRQDEREACAKLCEEMGTEGYGTIAIGIAIRDRGET
jgi:hypothetical protein